MITCGRCGVMNPAGATMCGACHAPIVYAPLGYAPPSPYGTAAPHQAPVYQAPPAAPLMQSYQAGYAGTPVQTRTSGMAIAGFVLSFFCGLLGLIFSIIGYNECKNSNGEVTGEGLALAGIIISIVGMLLGLMVVLGSGGSGRY